MARFAYDAYGNLLGTSPGVLNLPQTALLYTGQQFDPILLEYYLRARYYDPQSGRFTSFDSAAADSEAPLSLNKYLYTDADPINGADPSGQEELGDVLTAISIQVNNLARVAVAVGRVYSAVQTLQTIVDVIGLITDLGLGGAIRQQIRQAWNDHFASLKSNPAADVQKLFTSSFWESSGDSFARNSGRIIKVLSLSSIAVQLSHS